VNRLVDWMFRHRALVLGAIGVVTVFFAWSLRHLHVVTDFNDLVPHGHPYIEVNNQYKTSFGSANLVTIMVESRKGDVFQRPLLEKVQRITKDLEKVPGVNAFQITSLASKKLKDVSGSTESVKSSPVMWPNIPATDAELVGLKQRVVVNPFVYGRYVSPDLKSALITVDFIDRLVDYDVIYREIKQLREREEDATAWVRVVGDPVVFGIVASYLPETLTLFLTTMVLVAIVLFFSSRTIRGTVLPMSSGVISGVWALGIAALLGMNFDPLVVVVALLVAARAVSQTVQVCTAWEEEITHKHDPVAVSKLCVRELFRPGFLAIVVDGGAMLIVALTPIPVLVKIAYIGAIWMCAVLVTSMVITPLLLTYVKHPERRVLKFDVLAWLPRWLMWCGTLAHGKTAKFIVVATAVVFAGALYEGSKLTIGDATTGSSILWLDDRYNVDADKINQAFFGADRMFIVIKGKDRNAIKQPATLEAIERLQRFMETQPEIGGTVAITDMVPFVHSLLREGNPRYLEGGTDALMNGDLFYALEASSDPGDLDQFVDGNGQIAAVTAFFRDRRGATVRTAVARVKDYVAANPIPGAEVQLAGGVIGVIAAVNEVILKDQIKSIALALLIVLISCMVAYRSASSGMYFTIPVLLANAITFMAMAALGIGMNINTVPVAALGIGLGVDYAFFVVDRIKREMKNGVAFELAINKALLGEGHAVIVTAATLFVAVSIWMLSSLKFQASMGMLMGLWLVVSAITTLMVMPAFLTVFKPSFLFEDTELPVSGQPAAVPG
jgi:predicted RND superfamily exporter protein